MSDMDLPLYHLSATVPIKSAQYLEWLGMEAKATGGARLSKTTIVRALINVAMRMEIDVAGVATQEELEVRIEQGLAAAGNRPARELSIR
jgi:hypothetical protein